MSFVDLPKEKLEIPTITIDQEKIELDAKYFFDNDIILIDSGTATGKTQCMAKITKELKSKYQDCNILSIVNLVSLSREQISTFREKGNVNLNDYQVNLKLFSKNDGVICLNSLFKLSDIEDFKKENVILYIDEVNDLIRSLTHNDNLDGVLNSTYVYLISLIKECRKIIFSDATIDQNTLNLLSTRKTNNKTILIKNKIQKFKGIKALKYVDENKFMKKLREHIKGNKYFLIGSDGCKFIETIYHTLIEEFKEKKDDFLLFTGKQLDKVDNANLQFKDKFVFYSPTITTGISFVLEETPQTQFMYFTKTPKITPISAYQMSCRTRNIKQLIYYANDIKPREMIHKTLNELEIQYKKMIKINNRLLNMSSSKTENDESSIVNNTFFKLFCYNEYQDEIFRTGYIEHYENLLKKVGFEIEEKGTKKRLEHMEAELMKTLYDENQDIHFDNFIDLWSNLEPGDDISEYKKYKFLSDRVNLLNITSKEEIEKFKLLITDDYALKSYYNLLNLFKTDEYIKIKYNQKKSNMYDARTVKTSYNKILLLQKFEEHYKIKRFDFDLKNIDVSKEISNKFKVLYGMLFPKRTIKDYTTKQSLLNIYVNIIRNIIGDIKLIKMKKAKILKKCVYKYEIDCELLKDLINLCKCKNPILKNFDIELIEKLTDIKPESKQIIFLGDEDIDYNNYAYNRFTNKQGIKKNISHILENEENEEIENLCNDYFTGLTEKLQKYKNLNIE